jgi:hypothetical protein
VAFEHDEFQPLKIHERKGAVRFVDSDLPIWLSGMGTRPEFVSASSRRRDSSQTVDGSQISPSSLNFNALAGTDSAGNYHLPKETIPDSGVHRDGQSFYPSGIDVYYRNHQFQPENPVFNPTLSGSDFIYAHSFQKHTCRQEMTGCAYRCEKGWPKVKLA